MVGGFYSYDNKTELKDLGNVCSGKSDARGLLLCEAALQDAGEVELVVSAKDSEGHVAQAASSVWVTRQGELWFGGSDTDRIDLLPEKKSYLPGETARFQVRMPFRFATALVAVEREGILETQVVQLNGQDPTVSLKVQDSWGPNVFVSVLALRGRLREVPWYSFFTWGYKAPREWWTAFWYEGREYVAPTALVDLSKPAFRLGVAEIRVGTAAHQLAVKVTTDQASYPVRGTAQVTISAKLPNGQPAAGAEVALAAVDQALLELMPNNSWNLLEAMLQRRAWGVETATAQMEIIGRRHYGRKAVPAGGGGGHSGTRELLDTLLLWSPRVVLDAQGQAVVKLPLNDALTTFKIVAVADASAGLFGTGSASIRATQDLQIISGLPPLVREDDSFQAMLTLRNTTTKPMKVQAAPRATLLSLASQTVEIPAGEARELSWPVTVPTQLGQTRATALMWEIEAKDLLAGARDALKVSQRVLPAVPLTVQQATLVQLDGPYTLDVAPPGHALPDTGVKRGGLKLALQPRLAEGLPGVRDWFARYPYACLEQQASKAMGLRDVKLWQTVVGQMPSYLDSDGLASYFPPREGEANHGSDVLTAYLLAASHEAAALDPAYALPDSVRAPMERGLIAFVEGRITREHWSLRKDLDVRKLAAIEALSRHGQAKAAQLQSITLAPNQWPTHAVIDWLNILRRVQGIPKQAELLNQASQVLKSRLAYQGSKLVFSTEQDDQWWWLMANSDANTARLMLAVMDDPAWTDDMGRLANGFIQRQQGGAWHTTTANLWGGLALERFSKAFEATPVAGRTQASLGGASASVDWVKVDRVKADDATGLPHQGTWFGAPASPGNLRHNDMFLPWPNGATNAATTAVKDTLTVTHQGSGKPWLTLQSVASVALKAPFSAGYQIKKTITPVEQAIPGRYSRGDVLRITLEVNASADMSWVVISDPVPAGATVLGSGLGARFRDRHTRRKSQRPRLARVRGAQLRSLPRVPRVLAQGRGDDELHPAPEQRGQLRAPALARGGHVRARDVWRGAQPAPDGGSGEMMRARWPRRLRLDRGRLWPRLLACAALTLATQASVALPGFEAVKRDFRSSETLLLDRDGEVVQRLRTDPSARRGAWQPLDQVSPALRQALLVSEDKRFYAHSGVDWQAVSAAAWGNLWHRKTRGASTLTMQLAALLDEADALAPRIRPRRPAQPGPEAGPGPGRADPGAALAQGPDPGGLPEPGAVPR